MFAAPAEAAPSTPLKSRARMTRYGGDCYGYCLLAAGFVDLIVESGLKSYDIVALVPIIEAAGGRVTTWEGGPATDGGRIIAAGDAASTRRRWRSCALSISRRAHRCRHQKSLVEPAFSCHRECGSPRLHRFRCGSRR